MTEPSTPSAPTVSLFLPASVLLILILLAAFTRFGDLDTRPLHTDEAIHGIKLLELAEEGYFDYDPLEYHGPTLHYSTLVLSKIGLTHLPTRSEPKLGTDAAELRKTTVYWGILLVIITFTGCHFCRIPLFGTAIATTLLAFSPAFSYFSRYYIMEVPFVAMSAAFIFATWIWWQSGHRGAALVTSLSAALMHATKETCIIPFGAVILALLASSILAKVSFFKRLRERALSLATLTVFALLLSAFILSDGFQNWSDVKESYTTYFNYLTRADGSGHEHPFAYYFQLLWPHRDGYWWGEPITLVGGILSIALIIISKLFRPNSKPPSPISSLPSPSPNIFLSILALVLWLAYSAIPYKTPWTILGAYWVLFPLFAILANTLWNLSSKLPYRISLIALFLWAAWSMKVGCDHVNGRMSADTRNPWVYSHTSTNFISLVSKLRTEFESNPGTSLNVIHPESAWPLPWYLRDQPKVAYFSSPETATPKPLLLNSTLLNDAAQHLRPTHSTDTLYGLRPDSLIIFWSNSSK